MEILTQVFAWFSSLPDWFNAVSGIIASAAVLAALTPTPKDDAFLAKVRKVLDWLAMNVLFAKNK
jgi:hypothetical protein